MIQCSFEGIGLQYRKEILLYLAHSKILMFPVSGYGVNRMNHLMMKWKPNPITATLKMLCFPLLTTKEAYDELLVRRSPWKAAQRLVKMTPTCAICWKWWEQHIPVSLRSVTKATAGKIWGRAVHQPNSPNQIGQPQSLLSVLLIYMHGGVHWCTHKRKKLIFDLRRISPRTRLFQALSAWKSLCVSQD